MNKSTWFKDAIIYQIYPLSFSDANGDGIGDIKGITNHLDHLKMLGVNTVWLSPVYCSPMEDNGYDISDYMNINPMFGTMDDFKEMVAEMHKRGIKLVMDLVMNHTSDKHFWFQDSLKSKDSKYRDYYIWKNNINGKVPTNWTGFFGEGAWTYSQETDSYYLHLFAKGQPDLNWDNKAVREEFKKIIKFWCDLGVDGYRLDVINLISKDQAFKNGKELLFLKGRRSFINGPHLHEYLQEINRDGFSQYDIMTVGETVFTTIEDIDLLTNPSRNELSMVFNFDHTSVDNFFGVKWFMRRFSLKRFKKILDYYQINVKNGWNSLFFENHDQRRSVGRFNTSDGKYRVESAKMLATAIYFLKGTPFIYQGQEIGMTNSDIDKIEDYKDVETKNIYKTCKHLHLPNFYIKKTIKNGTRDNARTPMQWDSSEYCSFSDVTPWLKVNANKHYINVKDSYVDNNSIFNFYKKLIKIRKQEPLVKVGEYKDLMPKSKKIFMYERTNTNQKLLVIANFSDKKVKLSKQNKQNKKGDILLNNYETFDGNYLLPYQAVVIKIIN